MYSYSANDVSRRSFRANQRAAHDGVRGGNSRAQVTHARDKEHYRSQNGEYGCACPMCAGSVVVGSLLLPAGCQGHQRYQHGDVDNFEFVRYGAGALPRCFGAEQRSGKRHVECVYLRVCMYKSMSYRLFQAG